MTQNECPKCGRPIQKFNGHIGYCSQHKWVSPLGLSFDAEASAQNRMDADAVEHQRFEHERAKQEEQRRQTQEKHQANVRKAIFIVIALCVIVVASIFFIVRPNISYSSATDKFLSGDYYEAREAYSLLDNYKDSESRTLLCDAMIDLQENRTGDAITKLDQLTSDSTSDAAKQLADAFLPIVNSWQAKGLTPQALLLLLSRAEVIDPGQTLNTEGLSLEAHIAMLDDNILASYLDDVNADGTKELIALNQNYTVTVFRMTADGNSRIAVDNKTASTCGMRFGEQYKESSINVSVACFEEAYRIMPSDTTREALTESYHLRALSSENTDDMVAAIEDARNALETTGLSSEFDFFYDMNLRYCKNGRDGEATITMWNAFADNYSAYIARFGAKDRWESDAAQLHIARSAEFASRKDDACIAEIRTAAEMGADVINVISEAASRFELGFTLARLRIMQIEYAKNADAMQAIRIIMADEVRMAIREWKDRGIAAVDVPMLIRLADEQGISLCGIDRDAIYEDAALEAAGLITYSVFVNWDNDPYKELLAINGDGYIALYGAKETWGILSSIDTGLTSASFNMADESAPLILVVSEKKDEMLALTGTSDSLRVLFQETGISRYRVNASLITFSRLLEGSIERYNDYQYEAIGLVNRPVRIGIDWRQSDYPMPKNAVDAVQRYFEARAYDIPDEVSLLTTADLGDVVFSAAELASIPTPDVPVTVSALPYLMEEDTTLFEVTYPSNNQSIRTWVQANYDEGWKVVGASSTYGSGQNPADVDFSLPLLSLNAETSGTVAQRGVRHTYRLLFPTAGRLYMVWQAGDKTASRTAYNVSLYRGSIAGETVVSYDLQLSVSKQQTKPMFMSAGVYYVTVEAKISDAPVYHLTMSIDAETHVELESNDTSVTATTTESNTTYSASLLTSKDIDFYSFELKSTSRVNIAFGAVGNCGKIVAYTYSVYNASDGTKLTSINVPGNVQLTESGNLYLSPGAYLIQVTKGSTWVNDEYTLTVNVSQEGVMESESNNTPETANVVPVNEDIRASIGQEGDIDCFTFTLVEDAVVQPRFTFKPTDSSSKTYMLTLMDSTRRELLRVNMGGKESTKVIPPVALTAGTYAVSIENPRFIRQDYTLHLMSVGVSSAEVEPNDIAALATDLVAGSERTGVLSSDADVDYYKLTFAEQTTVTLVFSFPQITSTNTAYTLAVEQNGKTQWTANVKGDIGGTEQQLQFPAGEYYIKVKPSTWTGAVYTIGIR